MRSFVILAFAASLIAKPDWDALRSQMRQTLHVPEPLPNVADKLYGRFKPAQDVAADRVSYATDYGLRVSAIVYHQAGATIAKHPALIIVNGPNGDKSSWYAYWAGILYARAGAVVLTYDPIGEFERHWQKKTETNQHDTELESADMARRLSGLMITDIMQGARYLAQRPDVDPKNIAVLGYSMGSLVSSFACALDTSLRACVLVGSGDLDGQVRTLLDTKKDVFQYPLPPDGGHRPYFLTKPVALWLNERLKFPNWTKKQLLAMPETHISEWATQNHLNDGGPRWSELHEGGTMALGTDIPAVPASDLRAIPDTIWNAEQDNYVYESWRQRAKAAVK